MAPNCLAHCNFFQGMLMHFLRAKLQVGIKILIIAKKCNFWSLFQFLYNFYCLTAFLSKLLTYDQKTFFGNHTQQPNVVYNCAQIFGYHYTWFFLLIAIKLTVQLLVFFPIFFDRILCNASQMGGGGLVGLKPPSPPGVSVQPEIVNSTTHQKRLPMIYGFKNYKEFW